MPDHEPIHLFWFRRDLRLEDNAGLYHALKEGSNVQPIFIFDKTILDKLEDNDDRRVSFIHAQLCKINTQLQALGSSLWVFYGTPQEVFGRLLQQHNIAGLFANRDYEPYARERDKNIYELFQSKNLQFRAFKDQVIFEKDEVVKEDGKPYTVYTPYSKKWKSKISEFYLRTYPVEKYYSNLSKSDYQEFIGLTEMGFSQHENDWPTSEVNEETIKKYHLQRDLPAVQGTTRISVHLRFGTLSIRQLAKVALATNEKWYNELIWREFYQMILWHFPHVVGNSFRPEYDNIEWRNNELEFEAWCAGKTGYPIVDAGMRELNATGFMHNRVRMIVASFLTKHLLIDWRWGEAYFARRLIDFDLASNNGGWQWAAGSGVDAAPYFRVFNPYLQTEKFDPDQRYIKKWVPELNTGAYPPAIVDHKAARERVLSVYKAALKR